MRRRGIWNRLCGPALPAIFAAVATAAFASADAERIAQNVKSAWLAFNELRDVAATHGASSELALRQMQLERYLADLDQTIGEMQTEVNTWHINPNRHNNVQEEFYQRLQGVRRERVETDRTLKEVRFQFQQIAEQELRQAANEGRAARRMDREKLIELLAGNQRKCEIAFRDAKDAVSAAATNASGRTKALRAAITKLKAGEDAGTLGSPDAFMAAFHAFCGGSRFFENEKLVKAKTKAKAEAEPRLARGRKEKPGGESSPMFSAKVEGDPARKIPPDARAFGGGQYKVFKEELTWHAAKAKCEEMGGTLAIVTDEKENRFITSLIESAGVDSAWLGASDEAREGTWVWDDGTPMRFNKWDELGRQPNHKVEGEDYLLTIVSRQGKWSDNPSPAEPKLHPGFVCEWAGEATSDRASESSMPEATITSGNWSIDGQDLVLDSVGQNEFCIFGDVVWPDYDLTFEAQVVRGREGFFARAFQTGAKNFAKVGFGAFGNTRHVIQIATPASENQNLAQRSGSVEKERAYAVKISVRGDTVRSYLDGDLILEATDPRFSRGQIGLGSYHTTVRFRDIVVTSPSGQVLFKGLPKLPTTASRKP